MLPEARTARIALYASWQRLMEMGLPLTLLASVAAWRLAYNEGWDLQVERPLYTALCLWLLLLWPLVRLRRLHPQTASDLLTLGGGLWLLLKLWLLLLYAPQLGVFVHELMESLMWFPILLCWGLITQLHRRRLRIACLLLAALVLVLVFGAIWPPSRALLTEATTLKTVLELLFAATLGMFGLAYLGHRMDTLSHWNSQNEMLSRLAQTDMLTGLPGRLSLERALSELTATPESVGLLFVDVDAFKVINDTLGHAAGDELLRGVAQEMVRLTPPRGSVYRLSGDEFVVLLPGLSAAEVLAQAQILQAEATRVPGRALGVALSLSVGVSLYPEDASTPAALLRHADSAMYAVKRAGRGQVRRYQREQDAQTERFQRLAAALGIALERREFHVVFQPIYHIRTGRLVKAEALLRWTHPELGQVTPGEFVPVLERTGLILPVGLWVLEEACRAALAWPHLTVSVNVSPVQLLQADFVERVLALLRQLNFPPSRLELELTETAVMHEDGRAQATLEQLFAAGMGISIDDFGTGYSNLARFQQLRITGVKLDRSIVRALAAPESEHFARALTSAVVRMMHPLGISVTAEGVECATHGLLVQDVGCDLAQGFGLSRPLLPGDLTELYQAEPAEQPPLTELLR